MAGTADGLNDIAVVDPRQAHALQHHYRVSAGIGRMFCEQVAVGTHLDHDIFQCCTGHKQSISLSFSGGYRKPVSPFLVCTLTSGGGVGRQCLIEIRDQIVGIFEPDLQADNRTTKPWLKDPAGELRIAGNGQALESAPTIAQAEKC